MDGKSVVSVLIAAVCRMTNELMPHVCLHHKLTNFIRQLSGSCLDTRGFNLFPSGT